LLDIIAIIAGTVEITSIQMELVSENEPGRKINVKGRSELH
jgi:hypothetical protein